MSARPDPQPAPADPITGLLVFALVIVVALAHAARHLTRAALAWAEARR